MILDDFPLSHYKSIWHGARALSLSARPHLVRVCLFGVEQTNSAAQRAASNGQISGFRPFSTHPGQTCAEFGVKRTSRGRAHRTPLSSRGPPVGDTSSPFASNAYTPLLAPPRRRRRRYSPAASSPCSRRLPIPNHVPTWPPPRPRFRRSFGRRPEEVWPSPSFLMAEEARPPATYHGGFGSFRREVQSGQ